MASSRPSFFDIGSPAEPHGHAGVDLCPLCDQPVPHDRAEEIARRLETLEQERTAEITTQLTAQAAAEKAAALAEAEQLASERIAAAREKATAEAASEAKNLIDAAEAAKTEAWNEAAAQKAQLAETQRLHAAQLEQISQDTAFNEAEVARKAKAAAETAAQATIVEAQRLHAEAEARAEAARVQAANLEESFVQRLTEHREALEADKAEALNKERSDRFEERQNWQTKVEKLQRDLERKSNEELGEGAHIDLLESLKAEFKGDVIERIKRGQPGADIRHVVLHNGKACGTILYDSKNHGAWRHEFVTKLKNDQLADQADHAVLVTSAFPADTRHVCVREEIIVVSPARAIALVQIVRRHMVQTHALRTSNAERAEKTGQLYDFIISPRCAGLLARVEGDAAKLADLQVKEMQQHKINWQNQGKLISSIQKTHGDLTLAIDGIIGIADSAEDRA